MADPKSGNKPQKLKARLPRGLADRGPAEIAATRQMVEAIRTVFERYGFEPVETPAIEYTDALGKFLPDQDRPNEGVFSFQDDDEQWLSLRYDLTAPLARYVAENFQNLALPYRSYRYGYVYRNEKPGPGRFRQFMQFDADTVGAASMAADAEMCMLAADTMEKLGIKRGQYIVKVNNRKVLDGALEFLGLGGPENASRRLTVLRALDKLDRLGFRGVSELLGQGRLDESGDYTKGAELSAPDIDQLVEFVVAGDPAAIRDRIESLLRSSNLQANQVRKLLRPRKKPLSGPGLGKNEIGHLFNILQMFPRFQQPGITPRRAKWRDDLTLSVRFADKTYPLQIDNLLTIQHLRRLCPTNALYQEGLDELEQIASLTESAKYGTGRILINPSVVRGLEYYTGPVYEVELTFEIKDDKGRPARFGSVGGGGRYDGLVSRFMGQPVPATGFSIGVSRLQAALTALGKVDAKPPAGPVLITVFGAENVQASQKLATALRNAGIRAEPYLGNPKHGIGQQLKYADRRGSPCAVIQGPDEKAKGEVQLRDLIAGSAPSDISDRDQYLKKQAEAQVAVKEDALVAEVRKLLARHNIKTA